MARNSPDERVIYLTLKDIFRGPDAQLRKSKKVRELIQKHQNRADVRDLIEEHSIENVYTVTKVLLEQQVFESTLRAKLRFPEVFEVSPAQSAEREASEAEAAKTEADAIRDAAEGRQGVLALEEQIDPGPKGKRKERASSCQDSDQQSRTRSVPYATILVPSLYPVYLPYNAQHQLLVKVQTLLERACYNFARTAFRDLLAKEGWDCPESVELNQWTRIFLSNQDKFSKDAIDELGKPFEELLDSITQVRHSAVHRLRLSVKRIEQFMVDAESLGKLLQDDVCNRKLSRLRRETEVTVDEFKRQKDLLESRLLTKLKDIAAQRAELEHLERVAVADMLKEDKDYQGFAGANLSQAIMSPETVVQSEAATENETGSETDIDALSFDGQDAGPSNTQRP